MQEYVYHHHHYYHHHLVKAPTSGHFPWAWQGGLNFELPKVQGLLESCEQFRGITVASADAAVAWRVLCRGLLAHFQAMALPSMPATRQLSLPLPGNMSVVGIDFGNDTCYISVARQGGIESIANDYSLRETPSYVAFGEKSRTIGVAAKSGQMTQIKRTFFGFKKLLGR